jgi:hypothetical protein
MPMLFSPTIGAAMAAGYWFIWVRCPACRMTSAIDLRTLDRHPILSCRSCRSNVTVRRVSVAAYACCDSPRVRRERDAFAVNIAKLPELLGRKD